MAKSQNENIVIAKWMSLKHTITYLGEWEALKNPNFNYTEFGLIRNLAGDNNFALSTKEWTERTGAIGVITKTGRYAHKDIAFQFGMWISPRFQLLLVTEFQRLKDLEAKKLNQGWDLRHLLSKANYKIQTDAVKDVLIPLKNLPKDKKGFVYATEADLLYQAMYGFTAKQQKENNPDLALHGHNLRDYATIHQLIVLNNLEIVNAELIRAGVSLENRFVALRKSAIQQLKSLLASKNIEDADGDSPHKLKSIDAEIDNDSMKKGVEEKKDLPNKLN